MMRNPTTIKWKRTCACATPYISPSEIHPAAFRLQAMAHPRCVGWGEIGLDYHYDNSPRDLQRRVFIRQLRQAVELAKPLTIHTREAEEDTLRILKEEVPKDHRVSHSILHFFII
jgi:Tat protein secretion system quality control protein TatD with DNase activity